jgi:hypothetical protein
LHLAKIKIPAVFYLFLWITPIFIDKRTDDWHHLILDFIKSGSLVKKGNTMILTQRRFPKQKGGTDSLEIYAIE